MTNANSKIENLITNDKIVLFMKGSVTEPQCGFSAKAVAILQNLGTAFKTVNVLEDQEVRDAVKAYSQWPTIPQLYINKEFVGGSDIMMEMYESGELKKLLEV